MQSFDGLLDSCGAIEEKLGYQFKKKALLGLAFVHRSFFNEHRDEVPEHNERLEFLGDSVLGLLISDYLYEYLPSRPEGDLSDLRSHLVEAGACAAYLQKLGVAEYVLLGKGEKMNPGKGKESILADLFEALIGAIYLDGGLEACKQFFFRHFLDDVEALLQAPLRNWKAELQDYSQKKHQRPPFYKVMKEAGPDHSKVFHVSVFIVEEEMGQGCGSSKKQAEQMAAEQAVQRLGL